MLNQHVHLSVFQVVMLHVMFLHKSPQFNSDLVLFISFLFRLCGFLVSVLFRPAFLYTAHVVFIIWIMISSFEHVHCQSMFSESCLLSVHVQLQVFVHSTTCVFAPDQIAENE